MANKYLIEGATYCGDGTASNEAASAGAAGAWNNINVLEGTAPAYGTLAAGDIVYIRSKTSAGADITRTLTTTTSLGSSAATTTNWITWVIDNGTIWSGVSGTLTYESPSTYRIDLINYNDYIALTEDALVLKETNTSADNKSLYYVPQYSRTSNVFFDMSANTHYIGSRFSFAANSTLNWSNPHIKVRRHYSDLIALGEMFVSTLYNPRIELLEVESTSGVFSSGVYGGRLNVIGGRIYGAGATSGASVSNMHYSSAGVFLMGTQFPKTMSLVKPGIAAGAWRTEAFGADYGAGSALCEYWGEADSRSDNNPPTLDAYLPFSTDTPWSWKIYPSNTSTSWPFRMPVMKLFTDTASTKTITVNFLLADSITLANKNTMWIEVSYIDATTGEPRSLSTKGVVGEALETSTANWSATTWGSISLVKRKLSISTPTAIKQDTPINVTLCGSWKSASALDLVFLCPDVSLS